MNRVIKLLDKFINSLINFRNYLAICYVDKDKQALGKKILLN